MSEEKAPKYTQKKYYDNVNVGKRTKQELYLCTQEDKAAMFALYLEQSAKKQRVVVTQSKKRADELSLYLNSKNIQATPIHGNHRKEKIEQVMQEFNAKSIDTLITTDKILQSLELQNLEAIISYDIPIEHEDYFSRLLLVDEVGESILFVSPQEQNFLSVIEMRQKNEIPQHSLEGFSPTHKDLGVHATKEKKKKPRHRGKKNLKKQEQEKPE